VCVQGTFPSTALRVATARVWDKAPKEEDKPVTHRFTIMLTDGITSETVRAADCAGDARGAQ
jgi:hypothetical protein